MDVIRLLPTDEAEDLLTLARELARKELAPFVDEAERAERFPRETLRTLGRAGLLSLPFPVEYGGGGQPFEVYLQVIEELGATWATVGLSVSLHSLTCLPIFLFGTEHQRRRWLPELLNGEYLGGYCLSEAHAGSDPGALRARAIREGDNYVISGAKAWTTHGGQADYYIVMARTGEGSNGISCFYVPADTPGVSADPPEEKMGLTGSPTATVNFDSVRIPAENRIGAEGEGLRIALTGLNSGRLGIAALATGLSQAALSTALAYAKERETFGKPIIEHQGLAFLLADMAASTESSRANYLQAARLRDAGRNFTREAAIAKLICTDNAMKVTTDAVQVLGGAGYTRGFPAERYMREAKVMQIFEGTNEIQRLVIARSFR